MINIDEGDFVEYIENNKHCNRVEKGSRYRVIRKKIDFGGRWNLMIKTKNKELIWLSESRFKLVAKNIDIIKEIANIYISPDGNDKKGEGTEDKPYKTIKKAISEAPYFNKKIHSNRVKIASKIFQIYLITTGILGIILLFSVFLGGYKVVGTIIGTMYTMFFGMFLYILAKSKEISIKLKRGHY